MKKFITAILALMLGATCLFSATAMSCGSKEESIIVYTNAFFAPFEYYDGTEIKGVDIDIMNKVGEKLGKKIEFKNVEFSTIIDSVAAGKVCDAGAAGITVTEERAAKVNFSTKYYKSVQYVIYKQGTMTTHTATDGTKCIYWSELAGKEIGVQLDTTGHIYVDIEINGDGPDYPGELAGSGAECTPYDNAQLAADAIGANQMDVVVVDELPAQFICANNAQYACAALYYDADTATEEEYAICVTKGNDELLQAINDVLAELLVEDANGESGIIKLVKQHMGLN